MKDPNKNSYLKGLLKRLTVMPNSDLVKAGKYISDYIEKQYKEFTMLEAEHLQQQKDMEEVNKLYHDAANALEEYQKKAEKTPAKRKTTKKPQ